MNTVQKLIVIADKLDEQGCHDLADRVDLLTVVAQDLSEGMDSKEFDPVKEQTLLFLMVQRYRQFFNSNIDELDYLGEEHIDVLKSAINVMYQHFDNLMHNRPKAYNRQDLRDYVDHIADLRKRFMKWYSKPFCKERVIVDRFIFLGELERLYNKLQRLYRDDPDFTELAKKFKSAINVFDNIVKQTSANIAGVDL
jgi:hypothetical protein